MSLAIITKVNQLKAQRAKQQEKRRQKAELHKPILTLEQARPVGTLDQFIEFASQCFIRSGTRLIPFTPLYAYQLEIARLAALYRGLIIVKDRQLGLTEVLTCWMLNRARLNPAYASAVFSLTERDAYKVSSRIKRMPSRIDGFGWAVDSMGIRQPANGGEMNFRPATENATRGLESIWDLFFDESGFLRESLISEMYAASTPSQEMVGEDARTFIVSTIPPEGEDSWFFERFSDGLPEQYSVEELLNIARSGGCLNLTEDAVQIPGLVAIPDEGGWVHIAISHKAHPIYSADPNYVENQRIKKKLTKEQAEREHNLGLPKYGASLFDGDAIERYATGRWQEPKEGRFYLASIDPNMGGNDDWTLLIWDITEYPLQLVAEYHQSNMLPGHCRRKSLKIISRYNVVLLGIEKNNGGLGEAEKIQEEYPKLRVEVVNTGTLSKIVNTDRIATALSDGDVRYPADWNGVQQMKKFSKKEREGVRCKDDAVCSWMVGFAFLQEALTLRVKRKHSVGGNINRTNDRLTW